MSLPKHPRKESEKDSSPKTGDAPKGPSDATIAAEQKVTALAVFLGAVASIGGFMFGYVR